MPVIIFAFLSQYLAHRLFLWRKTRQWYSTAHLEIPASQNIGRSLSSRSFLTADGKRANRAVQKVVVCA